MLIAYLFAAICCYTTSNLAQKNDSRNWTRIVRQIESYDSLTNPHGYSDAPSRIAFEQICDGRVLIALGVCNNAYVRCSYDPNGHYVQATTEECPMGKIFSGTTCEDASDDCLGTWSKQIERISAETEKLLEEMNFCTTGSGVYIFTRNTCSRQAYACRNQSQGFAITCSPGQVINWRPFGCSAYPSDCAPNKISMEKFAPLRHYAIDKRCAVQYSINQTYKAMHLKEQCLTWYIGCDQLNKDIIYCENGMIYDAELKKCRLWDIKDHCIMPDMCKNREWEVVSLGDCNRNFVYCRGQIPKEVACAEGFVFFSDHCVPVNQAGSQCWECRNGEKRHSSSHSCNEYSVCENGRWKEHNCPSGMSYFETGQVCQPDISCTVSVEKPCTEGEIVDTFDCQFYHLCFSGTWNKVSCPKYSAEVCAKCPHDGNVAGQAEGQCMQGDTKADLQNCGNYAVCDGGTWRNVQCGFGLFWNQNLHRCDYTSDCKAFKNAECNHGERLVGQTCNEYFECVHGSWITMQCLAGYAFDVNTKNCIISHQCSTSPYGSYFGFVASSYYDYLNFINTAGSLFQSTVTTIPTSPSTLSQPTTFSPSPSTLSQPTAFSPNPSTFAVDESLDILHALPSAEFQKYCPYGSTIHDEYDCSKYFECTLNGYKLRHCEKNYEFNDENGRCEEGYRCDRSHCRTGQTLKSEICGHYQICLNGVWHEAMCLNKRQFADGHCLTKTCDDDGIALSLSSLSCTNGDAVADGASECKRYFICTKGRFRERFCRDGTSFDEKRGYCTQHANCTSRTSCTEGEMKADRQSCNAYHICKDSKFELHFCPHGLIYSHSERTCKEGSCAEGMTYDDACKESGSSADYRAHPLDCRKFQQCAQGKWISKTCPADLYWHPGKTACDWPRNVDSCKQRNNRVST